MPVCPGSAPACRVAMIVLVDPWAGRSSLLQQVGDHIWAGGPELPRVAGRLAAWSWEAVPPAPQAFLIFHSCWEAQDSSACE